MPEFANVIVDISHERLDRTFQYRIPERLKDRLQPGSRVRIPFGGGNRMIEGYVTELTDRAEYEPDRMKEIGEIAGGGLAVESELIALAGWIKEHYGSTMIQALKTVMPVKDRVKEKEERWVRLCLNQEELGAARSLCIKKHQTARLRLLEALKENPRLPWAEVAGRLKLTMAALRPMEEAGQIRIEGRQSYRNPAAGTGLETPPVRLNEAQQFIVNQLTGEIGRKDRRPALIFGVTGSGKTEVYMELISRTISAGRQAIVLIPEIALTFQTVQRFCGRFGDRVSFVNSRMSAGERYDQFERARKGELDVMVGPRSALFTPFGRLGLIIIDEEHEHTYKSENMPRYHARETAIARAELCGGLVVLGSATPSVESYYQALTGRFRLFHLKKRASADSVLPQVSVVDLRKELEAGNQSVFSRELRKKMESCLGNGQQMMLFLNRRGYAGFVSCRSCGKPMKCPHCDVSLTAHRNGRLVCHYCGYSVPLPKACPSCGSPYIAGFGMGTQKVEALVGREFPGARVLRMDYDTTAGKGGHQAILEAFGRGEADILIGTQMIVKGHDFPGVTLVGILAADLSLHAGDYRSSEVTFQLLTQAAGRAGRRGIPGEVVIQTYMPEHYAVQAAAAQDYEEFYHREILYRNLLKYPPAGCLMALQISSASEEAAEEAARGLANAISDSCGTEGQVTGPADAPVLKVRDIYRKLVYAKAAKYSTLIAAKDRAEAYIKDFPGASKVQLQFDFS